MPELAHATGGRILKAGIGYANQADPVKVGREAATQAIKQGKITQGGLALAFCARQVDHEGYWLGLRSVLGEDIPIIGGSAVGVITGDTLSYHGFPAGVAVIECDSGMFPHATAGDLDKDERASGFSLGEKLKKHTNGGVLTIFYDSVRTPATATSPPEINSSAPLLDGIEDALGQLPVVGAGLVGDYTFNPVTQFCGDHLASQSVTGIMIPEDIAVYSRIMHGCSPLDGTYHVITRMEGNVVREVDGKPVVRMIDEIYGHRNWRTQFPLQLLTIGVNHGDRYGAAREGEYVNRLITGMIPDGSGIGLFENDLEEGAEFQFMMRYTTSMMESTERNTLELMQQVQRAGKRPFLGIYIDCAGRAAEYSNSSVEEAMNIQNVMNMYRIPLIGFYSGVEIAPLLGQSRGLDWTGVLMILAVE